jgi:hypothetical protein
MVEVKSTLPPEISTAMSRKAPILRRDDLPHRWWSCSSYPGVNGAFGRIRTTAESWFRARYRQKLEFFCT